MIMETHIGGKIDINNYVVHPIAAEAGLVVIFMSACMSLLVGR